MKIISNHPLQPYNTFGIEAYAREFAEITTEEDLKHLLQDHRDGTKKLVILGGGSNILFNGDVAATVIKISTKGIDIIYENDKEIHLRVAAGEDWDGLAGYCVSKGWGGLENLSGIPGQVGSSPIQNIGAYGTEMKDHFMALEALNQCTGEITRYDKERCRFGYRDSIFKHALKDRVVITHVIFRLEKQPVFNLSYQGLNQRLGHLSPGEITLQKIRDTVLEIRASKLPDPKVIGNAGSFFKNPVIGFDLIQELIEKFPGIVYYQSPRSAVGSRQSDKGVSNNNDMNSQAIQREPQTDEFKLAAGWLIEQCGWKGFREGDAGVHKDQALVLVNYGKATGYDILDLSRKIQQSVRQKFGIDLEREVNII